MMDIFVTKPDESDVDCERKAEVKDDSKVSPE